MSESLGSAELELRADGSGLDRDMAQAESNVASRLDSAGQRMQQTGTTLTKRVTAPIVGMATAVLMTGAKFDDQMARVQAISGATGGGLDKLRGQAKEMGSTTRFSASEAAGGMEFLALAGFEVNEITDAMPGLLDLASAANLDLARTSDIVSDTMSAFKMDASQAGEAADIFAEQSSNSNTSVDQLGEAMRRAAPAAAAAGMSLGETSAMLGVLADSGIKGSRAGTVVDATLRDLVGSAEDGAVAIGDTSVAVFDAEGNFRSMSDIMRDVDTATQGMSDSQRENALRAVFQEQSLKGVNLMLGDGIDTFDEYQRANENSAGAAKEMAGIMEDTLGGSFRELKSQLEGVLISMSEELSPVVRDTLVPALRALGQMVSRGVEWFSKLDGKTKNVVFVLAGLAAAAGPVLIVLGTMVRMMATAIGALGRLGTALGNGAARMGRFVAATGRVIAATARMAARAVVAAAQMAARVAVAFAQMVARATVAAARMVAQVAIKVAAWALMGAQALLHAAKVAAAWFIALGPVGWVIATVIALVALIIANWDKVVRFTKKAWKKVTGWISNNADTIKKVVKILIRTVLGVLTGGLSEVVIAVVRNWDKIKATFSAGRDAVVRFVGNLRDRAISAIATLKDRVIGFFGNIRDRMSAAANAARDRVVQAFARLVSGARDKVSGLVSFVRGLPGRIKSAVGNLGRLLLSAGSDLIRGLISGIKNMAGAAGRAAKDAVKGAVDGAKSFLKIGSPSKLMADEVGQPAIQGVGVGIERDIPDVTAKLGAIANVDLAPNMGRIKSMGGRGHGSVILQVDGRDLAEAVATEQVREIRLHSARG